MRIARVAGGHKGWQRPGIVKMGVKKAQAFGVPSSSQGGKGIPRLNWERRIQRLSPTGPEKETMGKQQNITELTR